MAGDHSSQELIIVLTVHGKAGLEVVLVFPLLGSVEYHFSSHIRVILDRK